MAVDFETEIKHLRTTMGSVWEVSDVPALEAQIAELEQQAAAPDLWDDVETAQKLTSDFTHKQADLRRAESLRSRLDWLERNPPQPAAAPAPAPPSPAVAPPQPTAAPATTTMANPTPRTAVISRIQSRLSERT